MEYYIRKPKGQAGLDFEDKFVTALNGKKLEDLSPNLSNLIRRIFPGIKKNDLVLAQKADPRGKSDISLFTNSGRSEVSLKSVDGDLIHSSPNQKFIDYLFEFGVSDASIKTLLQFLYRDGTTDGSGERKWTYEETMWRLAPRIKDFNDEVNSNRDLLQDCVDLALFRGNHPEIPPANWLYHGTLDSGLAVSRFQVSTWTSKIVNMDFIRNPHIGPLHIRPFVQTMKEAAINKDKLKWLRLKWVGMDANLRFMWSKLPPYRREAKTRENSVQATERQFVSFGLSEYNLAH